MRIPWGRKGACGRRGSAKVARSAGAGVGMEDQGEFDLKGVSGSWRLFRVLARDNRSEVGAGG